ncbi:MAG: nitroreductase family protein [Alphaproteobacteria bacterium]|nr:nitroreductase family protein [Alphaproteobacteria bacterium]
MLSLTQEVPVSESATLKSRAWDLKTRLQWTGWLQYIPTAALALVFWLLTGLGALLGVWPALLLYPPLALASALTFILAFDLVTVRLNLRPPEPGARPLEQLDAFDLMRARRSCRSFQRRLLAPEHKAALLEQTALRTRPEHLLGEAPIRLEYIEAQLTVWPVVGAHEFLVAIAPKQYDRRAVIDVGRSLQHVVLWATRAGLATCWIGPGADHRSITRQLGERFDPARDHIICVCAVGYGSRFMPTAIRAMQRTQRNRLPIGELFYASQALAGPLDPDAAPFRRFGRCYEVCQWSPSSFNAQPTRGAAGWDEQGRLARFDFLASTTSRYYAPVALGIWLANWETGCEALGIAGHFERLSPEARGVGEAPELPRYDMSWVLEAPIS